MGALLYQTLRESIVDAIRSKIFNHEIKPGQRIVELELAKEFHTSRGPIREAAISSRPQPLSRNNSLAYSTL